MGVPRDSVVKVEPNITNLIRCWNGNAVKDRWAGLTTVCEGQLGLLERIQTSSVGVPRRVLGWVGMSVA